MTDLKATMLALLASLAIMATSKIDFIRYELRTVASIGKILLAAFFSIFVTASLLHGLDLMDDFLSIFNIKFP